MNGGFAGATQVAVTLVRAHLASGRMTPLLVLAAKRSAPRARIEDLARSGVPLRVLAAWPHVATIRALARVCREFEPDVLVAHGFSEHLWGRYAGLIARVPHLVHVEHNTRERYTRWRLAQSRWLARRTDRIVGCSEGVRKRLLELGFPPEKTLAIPNGISLQPFERADDRPYPGREDGIVMVARLSRQKDQGTLVRAVALLRDRGWRPPVLLVGDGKPKYRRPLERLAAELGVGEQVRFLGVIDNVPEVLQSRRFAVLSTHYEGMPLAVLEGMAAGCAVLASAVPGVTEVITDGEDGVLVPPGDARALADALERLWREPASAAAMARRGRCKALAQFSRERMTQRYEELFLSLLTRGGPERR